MTDIYFSTSRTFNIPSNLISLFHNEKFVVKSIEGIRLGQYEAATTNNPYQIGDSIQNLRILPKDIVVTLKPTEDKGDYNKLFTDFSESLGETVYLFWKDRKVTEGTFSMFIEGIMTECDLPVFEDNTLLSFTIHCEDPRWKGQSLINYSGQYTAITGTAPPSAVTIAIDNGTIPAGVTNDPNNWLAVGQLFFRAASEAVSGNIVITLTDTTKEIKVNNVSQLATIASPFDTSGLRKYISCQASINGEMTGYNFTVEYQPCWF